MKNFLNLNIVRQNYEEFIKAFGGDVYYAMKANPSEYVIRTLWEAGITGFDVASLAEIETIRNLIPNSPLLYTHPIKTSFDILRSHKDFDLKIFSIDCKGELLKLHDLLPANEVEVLIRVKTPIFGATAMQQLDKKFGAHSDIANALIQQAKHLGFKTGICFHVGSQQEARNAHLLAIKYLVDVLDIARGDISTLSIGGGFPASYTLGSPTEFQKIIPNVASIKASFPIFGDTNIVAEPGRCLVADTTHSEVTVVAVDGNRLFINDGVYGGLMDCGIAQMRFPITHKTKGVNTSLEKFTIFGPTCDSLDVLPGTYFLPHDTQAGDTLIVNNTGAYGSVLSQNFNGLVPQSTNEISGHELQTQRQVS